MKTARGLGLQCSVERVAAEQWDIVGLRGSCDYEGGFNWVHLQWRDHPAAAGLAAAQLPWE